MKDMTLKRRIEKLSSLLDRMTKRMERAFGTSPNCVLGNEHEHIKWYQIKINDTALSHQDQEGTKLLPTWMNLSDDLYSALHRTSTVLFDEDQILPKYRGNRKLLEKVIATADWERIHDMTMGDANMTVIAALRIQEGWLKDLQEQQEQARQRQQEIEQQRQQHRQEREKQQQERNSNGSGNNEQHPAGADAAAECGEPGDPEGTHSGAGEGPTGRSGQAHGSEREADVDDDQEGSDPAQGRESGDADTDGEQETEGPQSYPEPNNALEAFQAGNALASQMQAAQIALEEAERRAEASMGAGSIEDAIKDAEEALRAAEELEDVVRDQEAYNELTQTENAPGETLRRAIRATIKETKEHNERLRSWGLEKGLLRTMDPTQALELGKLLRSSENLRKIAELIGSNRIALQKRKTHDRLAHGPTVRIGVETGNSLPKLMPSQKMMMAVAPDLFRWRYANRNLQQYRTKMQQYQERGTGVIEIDSSGSMSSGSPFTYSQVAKATAISFIEYMQEEGRDCFVVLFDHGVRETHAVPKDISKLELLDLKIKIAERHYGGGTDFFQPIVAGFAKIRETKYLESADIALITDGQCYLSEAQMKSIKEQQAELRVNIITVLMPGGRAGQMGELGPVETVRTALADANKLALSIVEKMEQGYEDIR